MLRQFAPSAAELWRVREFLRQLVIRNLKVRYQRSFLGFVWLLANPILSAATLVLVFAYIVRLPVADYWAFVLSGYFAWVFVAHTIGTSTFIIPEHAAMAKSVAVPADIFVLGAAGSRLIEFVAELLLALVVLAVFHHHRLPASFLLLPVAVLLLVLTTLGLAFPAAALGVHFRDVQHGLPVALTMLMYASPVFYPARLVPAEFSTLYLLNPFAQILTLFHVILYEGRLPTVLQVAVATITSLAIYVAGHMQFRRRRALFPEIV